MPKPDDYVTIPVSEDVRDRARATKGADETWNDWVESRIDTETPTDGFTDAEREEIRRIVDERIESYRR